MSDVYNGRLVVVDGDLKAFDPDAVGDDIENADLKSVWHDVDNNCYRYVNAGEPTHNERHHKQFAEIDGTSGPLFNADGELVYPGDMHHESILPTDAHFSEHAPKNTALTEDNDSEAATVTGHTEAYTNV